MGTTTRRRKRLAHLIVIPILVGALLGGVAGAATSGWVNYGNQLMGDGVARRHCAKADVINNGGNPDFKGWARTTTGSGCTSSLASVPAGYLGAAFDAYRNGSLCGSAGPVFQGSANSTFGVGGTVCSNPSGNQNFHTVGRGYFWGGSYYSYNNHYRIYLATSPYLSI